MEATVDSGTDLGQDADISGSGPDTSPGLGTDSGAIEDLSNTPGQQGNYLEKSRTERPTTGTDREFGNPLQMLLNAGSQVGGAAEPVTSSTNKDSTNKARIQSDPQTAESEDVAFADLPSQQAQEQAQMNIPGGELGKLVADYQSRGMEPYIKRSVNFSTTDSASERLASALNYDRPIPEGLPDPTGEGSMKFGISHSKNPVELAKYAAGANPEIAPELRNSEHIGITPLNGEIVANPDGSKTITVHNAFDQSKPPIYQGTFTPEANGRLSKPDAERLQTELYQAWNKGYPEIIRDYKGAKAAAAPLTPQYVVSIDSEHRLSPDQIKAADNLYGKGFDITAEFYPHGGAVDRSLQAGSYLKDYNINITRETLDTINGGTIKLDGAVKSVVLSRNFESKDIVRGQDGKPISVNGQPVLTTYVDQYGNSVQRAFAVGNNSSNVLEHIVAEPAIAVRGADNSDFREVRVDLTPLGHGELPGIMSQRTANEMGSNGTYRYISNLEPEKSEKYSSALPTISEGITSAEVAFGAKPGSMATQLYLVNSEKPNAFFSMRDPSTVVIQDQLLDEGKMPPREVGFHEAVHLVDGNSEWKLSGGAVSDFHKEVSTENPNFFKFVDEKKFLPNTQEGGHSADNSKELTASLVNSIELSKTDPLAWEDRMLSTTPENRTDYARALKSLQSNLDALAHDPKYADQFSRAPIRETIAERLAWLENSGMITKDY